MESQLPAKEIICQAKVISAMQMKYIIENGLKSRREREREREITTCHANKIHAEAIHNAKEICLRKRTQIS
jgi:hypothetical protein